MIKKFIQRGTSVYDIINFFRVEPLKASDAKVLEKEYLKQAQKKRKPDAQGNRVEPLSKGTMVFQMVKFVEIVMDSLGRHKFFGNIKKIL